MTVPSVNSTHYLNALIDWGHFGGVFGAGIKQAKSVDEWYFPMPCPIMCCVSVHTCFMLCLPERCEKIIVPVVSCSLGINI